MDLSLEFAAGEVPHPCVGIFDSGVGGLTVLDALYRLMPRAPLLYVADSGYAPYGERGDEFVIRRSLLIASHLLASGAVGLVVACNTATAAAVRHLRERWPQVPIVGVEPGLKPAASVTRNGRIGVLATPGTLSSEKFRRLMQAQPGHLLVVPRPCPRLAGLIETGDLDAPALHDDIAAHVAALRASKVDTVVLGCTHYGFVRQQFEAALGPNVQMIDTAVPVARHAAAQLGPLIDLAQSHPRVQLQTTGSIERLRAFAQHWLPFGCEVQGWGGHGLQPLAGWCLGPALDR
jgi:glutamate racemase